MGGGKKLSKSKIQNIREKIKKEKKEIKDRIISDIWTLFETEEENEETN